MHWNRITIAGGLLGALMLAGILIVYNWGATPRLQGKITAVRTLGMEQNSSVAILNFSAENISNYEVKIDYRLVEVIDELGDLYEGRIISVFDIQQLFKYFPDLGGMLDEPLVSNKTLVPGESLSGLVAARFEIPKHQLDARRELVFQTMDLEGRKTRLRLRTP